MGRLGMAHKTIPSSLWQRLLAQAGD